MSLLKIESVLSLCLPPSLSDLKKYNHSARPPTEKKKQQLLNVLKCQICVKISICLVKVVVRLLSLFLVVWKVQDQRSTHSVNKFLWICKLSFYPCEAFIITFYFWRKLVVGGTELSIVCIYWLYSDVTIIMFSICVSWWMDLEAITFSWFLVIFCKWWNVFPLKDTW